MSLLIIQSLCTLDFVYLNAIIFACVDVNYLFYIYVIYIYFLKMINFKHFHMHTNMNRCWFQLHDIVIYFSPACSSVIHSLYISIYHPSHFSLFPVVDTQLSSFFFFFQCHAFLHHKTRGLFLLGTRYHLPQS